jgi:hypothetical protein
VLLTGTEIPSTVSALITYPTSGVIVYVVSVPETISITPSDDIVPFVPTVAVIG